ncbi:MAG: type II/IV secretion system protein, partial [Deltaproteobacteria bacterium]|nr:type II/IV secretion system protein [Deltaproteobacteria bacterium]
MSMDVNARIKEAEVYYSMGLTVESLDIYEGILSENPELDAEGLDTITGKIYRLKEEIADWEKTDGSTISAEEVSAFKESLAECEEVPAILDSAFAFKELGLFGDAISEYEKLFRLEYPFEMIIPDIVECLLRLHSPKRAVEEAEKVVSDHGLGKKEVAQIKFRLGLEMEERDHKELAVELYDSAGDMDPENGEIKNKLSSVMTSISSGSKYDYLLNQKMVNTEQLQKALALSKKTKKSVEWILVDQYKVKKDAVGKSLSFFYGCPFRIYDPELPTPVELICNLKKTFLLHELWVPLSWGKEGIEILIDDPRDLSKTDHIRTLLKTKKIKFSVAIKEDIEGFIKGFFDEKKRDDFGPVETMDEDFDLIPDISFEEEEEVDYEVGEVDEASGKVVKLVDQVLVAAFRKGASDIHIEPSPLTKATSVRFRMDGVCQE